MKIIEDIHSFNLLYAGLLWRVAKEGVAQAVEHFVLTREQAVIVRQLSLDHLQRSVCPTMLVMCPTGDIAGERSAASSLTSSRQRQPVGRLLSRARRREAAGVKTAHYAELRSVRHVAQQDTEATLAVLKDLNVQFLFLLRRVAGESVEEASVRFGLRQAEVEFVRDLSLDQLTRLASPANVRLTPRRLFLDRLAAGRDPIARSVALLRSLSDGYAPMEGI
jgi:hypothetical protein